MTAARFSAPSAKGALQLILALQVGIAVLLIAGDMGAALPNLFNPSQQPEFDTPVAPGDQTRKFNPSPRLTQPGTLPYGIPSDMPSRLLFEPTDIDGTPGLVVTGTVLAGDAARFSDALKANPDIERIALHSPGGSVDDALQIGRAIREAGLDTTMAGRTVCLSACPYILMGGVTRTVAPEASVGVHQHYFGENTILPAFLAVESIQRGQGEVMAFLQEMNIELSVMQPALLTPPDEIYVFVPDELQDYRIVTQAD
ncbi:hypothetical protein [Primorskyibacter flagellatus]|uniref:Periplasmic protein n=1 Tax=Primorskyibacter flagellatus TaxID=1387277 RepID=A0A1W2DHZ0_9RHOB|nr:hypothetical protein [Primorskyibacter flagellatus]SMC96682.1 hypothetical protein SAMN06295998_11426 [Primorskyibacter flagellatus]